MKKSLLPFLFAAMMLLGLTAPAMWRQMLQEKRIALGHRPDDREAQISSPTA